MSVVSKMIRKASSPWMLLALCAVNLIVMHYHFVSAGDIEDELEFTAYFDNFTGIAIDVVVVFLLSCLLCLKRMKLALSITFFLTFFWMFSNLIYGRFFHHYLTLSAIGQGGTLFDKQILDSVIAGLRWNDLLFFLPIPLYVVIIRNMCNVNKLMSKTFLVLVVVCCIDFGSHIFYCSMSPETRYVSFFLHRFYHRQFSDHLFLCDPNHSSYRRGAIRNLLHEVTFILQGTFDLSEKQYKLISTEMHDARQSLSFSSSSLLVDKNVIFILVESYMSFTSEMMVNGQEVTPFLNSLKRDSTVYYNGNMNENVTIGESSDGQFIYMTGILPLRSVITVSKARFISLPGLPKVLGRDSRMIIPTTSTVWNQDEMCRQYGFDHYYSSTDYEGDHEVYLNDEQIFKMAMEKDKNAKQPFFSVILTMSMHQPYTSQISPFFPKAGHHLDNELACYLSACHYTDRQIADYFDHLKKTGLYENSLIVIAADHHVHNSDLGGDNKHIPLYIVNAPIKPKQIWQGECNQLDVYTTLFDMIGGSGEWCGLGRSLLSPNYEKYISVQTWNVSEWVIMSKYFDLDKVKESYVTKKQNN
ncbi:lipoteichoic acid synthase [Prevotella sp. tf2-5]|nr:lipoteichoic acid synthase [Prevotella sp. tf2-5]